MYSSISTLSAMRNSLADKLDYVEIYELDERKRKPRSVDEGFMIDVRKKVGKAAQALRQNRMLPAPSKQKCATCDYHGLCTAGSKAFA